MDPDEVQRRSRKAKNKQAEEEARMDSPVYRFSVDITDKRGNRYAGEFVGKVPNLGDQIAIGQMKTAYLPAGSPADPNALSIAEMISYCQIALTEKPDWWKPHLFWDVKPLQVVYGRCLDFEEKFLGITSDGGGDARGASGEETDEGAAADRAGGDVDGGVQAPPKRREVL